MKYYLLLCEVDYDDSIEPNQRGGEISKTILGIMQALAEHSICGNDWVAVYEIDIPQLLPDGDELPDGEVLVDLDDEFETVLKINHEGGYVLEGLDIKLDKVLADSSGIYIGIIPTNKDVN